MGRSPCWVPHGDQGHVGQGSSCIMTQTNPSPLLPRHYYFCAFQSLFVRSRANITITIGPIMSVISEDQSMSGAARPAEEALDPAFLTVGDMHQSIRGILDKIAATEAGAGGAPAAACHTADAAPEAHTRWSEQARTLLYCCGVQCLSMKQLVAFNEQGMVPSMQRKEKKAFRQAVRERLVEARALSPAQLDHQEVSRNMVNAVEGLIVKVPKHGAAKDMPRVVTGKKFERQVPVLLKMIALLLMGHTVGTHEWRPFDSVEDARLNNEVFKELIDALGFSRPSDRYVLKLLKKAAQQHLGRRLSVFTMKVFKPRDTEEVQRIAKEAIGEIPRTFYPRCARAHTCSTCLAAGLGALGLQVTHTPCVQVPVRAYTVPVRRHRGGAVLGPSMGV